MDPMTFFVQFIQRLMNLPPAAAQAPVRSRTGFTPNAPESFGYTRPSGTPDPVPTPPRSRTTSAPPPPATTVPVPTRRKPPGNIFQNPYASNPVGGGVTSPMPIMDPYLTSSAPQTPYSQAAGNWALRQLSQNQDASSTDYQNLLADIRRQGNNFGPAGARYDQNGNMYGPTGPIGGYALTPFGGNPNTYVAPGLQILGNPTY